MESYLKISEVCKSYKSGTQNRPVLQNLSFTVQKAERVAIVGASGCGKSTLLNVIAGIDTIDSGSVSVAGLDLTSLDENQRTLFRRRDIGFIYQSFNLIQTLTALENVKLPLQLNRFAAQQIADLAEAMLERVGLADRAAAFPDQLSGGEQQRVAIARAMVHSPALVLADEHTGNLDADTGRQMMELFTDLSQAIGQTVVMVTHSSAVAGTADRILQVIDGQMVQSDSARVW